MTSCIYSKYATCVYYPHIIVEDSLIFSIEFASKLT